MIGCASYLRQVKVVEMGLDLGRDRGAKALLAEDRRLLASDALVDLPHERLQAHALEHLLRQIFVVFIPHPHKMALVLEHAAARTP